MARKKSFNPTEGLFSFPDPPKEKVPESAIEPKQVVKSKQTIESVQESKQVAKPEQEPQTVTGLVEESMSVEPKQAIEPVQESKQVVKPEQKAKQAIEPEAIASSAHDANIEPELKVNERSDLLPKVDLSTSAEQIVTEPHLTVAESHPEVKKEVVSKDATGIAVPDGSSTQMANIAPEEEIVRCTFRVTKVHAFYIQKTAVQKNSNINVVMTDILSKWLSEEISISDEEAISIIDSFAKERSSYINRTYGIPVSLREEFNNKAAEIGLKHTVLINHIIHEAINSVE